MENTLNQSEPLTASSPTNPEINTTPVYSPPSSAQAYQPILKIWPLWSITLLSFIFGPFAGMLIVSESLKRIGREDLRRNFLILGSLFTLLLVFLAQFAVHSSSYPSASRDVAILGMIFSAWYRFTAFAKWKKENPGAPTGLSWGLLVRGILGLIMIVILNIMMAFFFAMVLPSSVATQHSEAIPRDSAIATKQPVMQRPFASPSHILITSPEPEHVVTIQTDQQSTLLGKATWGQTIGAGNVIEDPYSFTLHDHFKPVYIQIGLVSAKEGDVVTAGLRFSGTTQLALSNLVTLHTGQQYFRLQYTPSAKGWPDNTYQIIVRIPGQSDKIVGSFRFASP